MATPLASPLLETRLPENAVLNGSLPVQEGETQRQATRAQLDAFIAQALKVQLLLQIRGGGVHVIASLLDNGLSLKIPMKLAIARHGLEIPPPPGSDTLLGFGLLLKDTIALLQAENLVKVMDNGAGEEVIQSTPRTDPRFELDPEFQNLLPRSADEVAALERLLLTEECHTPLAVWKGHGLLIDGHTRFSFLSQLGRPYQIIEMEIEGDREAVKTWIWAEHYARRSLTVEAKSYVRGRHWNQIKQPRGGYRRSAESKCKRCTLIRKAEDAAQKFRVNRKTIYNDGRFADALDLVEENCGNNLRQQVLGHAIKLSMTDIKKLAKLSADQQRAIVETVRQTGKKPAWETLVKEKKVWVGLRRGKSPKNAKTLRLVLGDQETRALTKALIAEMGEKL